MCLVVKPTFWPSFWSGSVPLGTRYDDKLGERGSMRVANTKPLGYFGRFALETAAANEMRSVRASDGHGWQPSPPRSRKSVAKSYSRLALE